MTPNATEERRFRYNARKVFLTYPRCDLSMQDMLEGLASIRPYQQHCISQENHADGGRHLHVLLQYSTPINTTNERYFDVQGYHPNITKPRDVKDVLKYIKKDGNFLEDWPVKRGYAEILSEATDKENFMSLMRENQPKDFVLNQERIEYYADKYYERPPSPYQQIFEPQPWRLPSQINDWVSTEFPKQGILLYYNLDRPKSLWICGPSRSGKTAWARSLGRHIYWGGMSNLDVWDPEASYLVIDDIKWEFVPQKKSLFGAQREFTLTDKYRKKRRIKWGKPCIYLFNPEDSPMSELSGDELSWYNENTVLVILVNKLY